jgi:hypothetical protein
MNKVVVASVLAVSALSLSPLASSHGIGVAFAQAAPAGQVAMPDAEFAVYDNAVNKQTTPAAQAPAIEDYLTKYPQSSVKESVLERLMLDYVGLGDDAHTIATADRILQVDPISARALLFEAYTRRKVADAQTDAAAKQSGLDSAATFAQKGLTAGKPAILSAEDYKKVEDTAVPIFYSVIAEDDLGKKDYPGAIAAFKSEIAASPAAATTAPGQTLQDIWYLGQAYYFSTPPDLLNCTFYTTRAAVYAGQFAAQLQPLATYCYKKYHGGTDGYDAVTAAATANLNPPADLFGKIAPAPTNADYVNNIIKTTPDLSTLALSDKEFILQYGKPDQAEAVFTTIKGKSVEIPGALVITSSPTVLTVAVSDDAVQSKTADFTFNMTPIVIPEVLTKGTPAAIAASKRAAAEAKKEADAVAAATAVGSKVTLQGTYASYTQSPAMLVMNDGSVVLPKPTKPAARPAPRRH